MKQVIVIILIVSFAIIGNVTYAHGNRENANRKTTVLIKDEMQKTPVRPRCPAKPIECTYGDEFVSVNLPLNVTFAEIEIVSNNEIIVSGIITPDYPTMYFSPLSGNYTLNLNTYTDDSYVGTYTGELSF